MDHATIEKNGLVERYHRGLLSPEEEERFEEHVVACAECTEQLELARGFQRGLKTMAAEDAARALVGVGLFAWLARRGRLAQWGIALAAVLVAGLPALGFLAQNRTARQVAAEWRQRWEGERQTAADLERRLAESETRRGEERRELESRLAQARPPEGPRGLAGPVANAAVLLLTAVRGEAGEPAATLDLGRTGEILSLAVDVGAGSPFPSYRATLTGPGGKTLFRQGGLQPNALEVLMITFPSSFFSPGEYRLRVEGMRADGGASEVGTYSFRVLPARAQ